MIIRKKPGRLLAVTYIYVSLFASTMHAEVVLDGTMGQGGALSGPDYAITQEMGQVVGSNLFHSFSDFNLNSTESATFSGSSGVNNVISRVTGMNPSMIDGTINSTISGADFYFINPNGVMFGENATLNISGSFYASTADYVTLGSNGRFDASQPVNSVLTTSAPSAFGFVDTSIAPITMTRSRLAVPQGEKFALIGGDFMLTGIDAYDGVWDIDAPSGRVDLISVASAGEVDVSMENPDVSDFSEMGNILLDDYFGISTRGDPGGTIYIRSGELVVTGSFMTSATTGDIDHAGTGIDIAVTGDIVVDTSTSGYGDGSEIASSSYGTGNAGDILISASRLILEGDAAPTEDNPNGQAAAIASRAWADGDSGDVEVNAEEVVLGTTARLVTESFAAGNASDLTVNASSISIFGTEGYGSRISSTAFATGNAGNLNITAGDILVQGGTSQFVGFTSQVASTATGAAVSGDINLITRNLTLLDGGQINAGVFSGSGDAGDINVTAENILMSGINSGGYSGGIFSSTNGFYASGNAGDINVTTSGLIMSGGARIDNSAYSWGGAGNININADAVQIYGAGIAYASTGLYSIGGWVASRGGNINVSANSLELIDGGLINTQTVGYGNGGSVTLDLDRLLISGVDTVNDINSQITASTAVYYYPSYALGNGGSIEINAADVIVTNEGQITTSSTSMGSGGDATINANTITISDDALITATSSSSGQAGSINLSATGDLSVKNARVLTSTSGSGDGGNTTIAAGNITVMDNGIISASSSGAGLAGTIDLTASSDVLVNNAVISTSATAEGNGGDTTITADNIRLENDGLVEATSTGSGQAGNIRLTAADSVTLDNSTIATSTTQSDGGDISIQTQRLLYLNNGSITTSVQGGSGNGGNIYIDPQFVVLNHGNITADAQGGNGGNILIVAENFLASPDSRLSASSSLGVDGTIVVNAPNRDVSGELEAVPEPAPDAAKYFRNDCVAVGSGFSSFVAAESGPAVRGSRDFIPSRYTSMEQSRPANSLSTDQQGNKPGKPALILARQGVDCLAGL